MAPDVRLRALHYGRECANGYLELLDHVLLVRKTGVFCFPPASLNTVLSLCASHPVLDLFVHIFPPHFLFPKSVLIPKPPFHWGPIILSIFGFPAHFFFISLISSLPS